jgi:hypothetical protein
MGMKYITITDHSPTAFYANGEARSTEATMGRSDRVQEL